MGRLIKAKTGDVLIPWFLRDKRYTPGQEFVAQARARRTGQLLPLAVRDDGAGGFEAIGEPLDWYALLAAGIGEVQCWSLGLLTDAEAIRIGFEAGLYDDVDWSHMAVLAKILFQQWQPSDIAQTMDLTQAELERLRELLEFDWNTLGDGDAGQFLFEGMEQ
tara:strand:- start:528 stop:1013 length:486 start_codon:yes stop_codon:yes gene_type:complete